MSRRRALRLVHFSSTAWLVLCVGYVLVLALRQAGFRWWVVFSLSGPSALLIFLLTSLYLFAIFRGIDRSQKIEIEHPLTSSSYYFVFYDISPFLGGLAGCLGMTGAGRVSEFLLGVAFGTLAATFLVWIVVDPAAALIERLLPASRRHRLERLTQVRQLRQRQQEERKLLLDEILTREEQEQRLWQEILQPYAEKLARLLSNRRISCEKAEAEVVDIGANAWRIGGLVCMQQLYSMTAELCRQKYRDLPAVDVALSWWDGIGTWRSPSLG